MKNYWFYYYISFNFINQHINGFEFAGLDYFRYMTIKVSIYRAGKTRIPALVVKVVIIGIGFEFCTHGKR